MIFPWRLEQLVHDGDSLPGTGDGGTGGMIGVFPLEIMQIQSWCASQFRSFHQENVPLLLLTISTHSSRPSWLFGSPWPQFVCDKGVPSLQEYPVINEESLGCHLRFHLKFWEKHSLFSPPTVGLCLSPIHLVLPLLYTDKNSSSSWLWILTRLAPLDMQSSCAASQLFFWDQSTLWKSCITRKQENQFLPWLKRFMLPRTN